MPGIIPRPDDQNEGYTVSGMSGLARTNVFLGIFTIRSSGPQLAVAGIRASAMAVMSGPMTAKSPPSSSQISGQPLNAGVWIPPTCGSGPNLRTNIPDYYYSNLCCQAASLVAVWRGKDRLPRTRFLRSRLNLEEGTGETGPFHDQSGRDVRAFPRDDQPHRASTAQPLLGQPVAHLHRPKHPTLIRLD